MADVNKVEIHNVSYYLSWPVVQFKYEIIYNRLMRGTHLFGYWRKQLEQKTNHFFELFQVQTTSKNQVCVSCKRTSANQHTGTCLHQLFTCALTQINEAHSNKHRSASNLVLIADAMDKPILVQLIYIFMYIENVSQRSN